MALIQRYINTASTPGGDGTTNATSGANRAYASMTEWEAAEQTDLVTAGDVHKVTCSGGEDPGEVEINGWTTSTDNYIIIEIDSGSYHGMQLNSGYRITTSNDFTIALLVRQVGTIINGISCYSGGSSGNGLQVFSGANSIIINCIFKNDGSTNNYTDAAIWNRGNGASGADYINCLAMDSGTGFGSSAFTNGRFYNCNAMDCTVGFKGSDSGTRYPIAINCVTFGNGTSWIDAWDDAESSHNATDDATLPAAMAGTDGGSNESTLITGLESSDFQNYSNNDFKLISGSALIDVGNDLEATLNALSRADYTLEIKDAFGNIRPQNSIWDIGIHEFVVSISNNTQINVSFDTLQAIKNNIDINNFDTELYIKVSKDIDNDTLVEIQNLYTITADTEVRIATTQEEFFDSLVEVLDQVSITINSDTTMNISNQLTHDNDTVSTLLTQSQKNIDSYDSILNQLLQNNDLQAKINTQLYPNFDSKHSIFSRVTQMADVHFQIQNAINKNIDTLANIQSIGDIVVSFDSNITVKNIISHELDSRTKAKTLLQYMSDLKNNVNTNLENLFDLKTRIDNHLLLQNDTSNKIRTTLSDMIDLDNEITILLNRSYDFKHTIKNMLEKVSDNNVKLNNIVEISEIDTKTISQKLMIEDFDTYETIYNIMQIENDGEVSISNVIMNLYKLKNKINEPRFQQYDTFEKTVTNLNLLYDINTNVLNALNNLIDTDVDLSYGQWVEVLRLYSEIHDKILTFEQATQEYVNITSSTGTLEEKG